MIKPDALNIKEGDLMPFAPFIVIIQLVIQFYNEFMKLYCDPCHHEVSIFSTSESKVIIFFYNISRIVRWILK